MLDVPLSVKIQEWREKAAAGDMSVDEMRQIILALRQGRVGAAAASAKSRAKKEPVNVQGLEDELDAL